MNTALYIAFNLASKSDSGRERVVRHIHRMLDSLGFSEFTAAQVKPDFRPEYDYYKAHLEAESWEVATYKIMRICQSLGRQWILTGDISDELRLFSSEPVMSGVNFIGVEADHPAEI